MKRSAMQHTKTKRLMRTLGIPLYSAVGVLEALWHLTAREAPQGNIGKLTDDDIADALGWDKNPSDLIEALIACGWIEKSSDYRLLVHDWHDHADDATKKSLQRQKLPFLSGNISTEPDKKRLPEPLPVPKPVPVPEKPSPANRGTRIPEGYQPNKEHIALANELGIDLRAEFPIFRDYWTAKAGKDAVKLDWDATLRNWIRNARDKKGGFNGKAGETHTSATKQRIDASRRVLAEIAVKRGLVTTAGDDGWSEPPLPFAGASGEYGGVPSGLREAVPEVLAPQGTGSY